MGIKGLAKLIAERAPGCMKENEIKNYFGRKVAIDASMSIYQFLIAVRSQGENLVNSDGDTTSHLMGLFYRTIRMCTNGIKPLYVFDGKPPDMKSGELEKRREAREKAQKGLTDAQETGNQEDQDKFKRRLVRVTPQHNAECQELLKVMGIPFMVAPCEAEAQCSELAKKGKVWATATEDMDALTFGTPVLLRHLTFSEARKQPIKEYHVSQFLTDTELSKEQFVDLCILLGCDYCDSIKGIGPKKAYDLIKQYKNIETMLRFLDKKKYPVPADWPYQRARELFVEPEVAKGEECEFKWTAPDEEALIELMCKKNGFAEDRIRSGAQKLAKARQGKAQGRLDTFFKPLPNQNKSKKRKAPVDSSKGKKAKASSSFFKKRR